MFRLFSCIRYERSKSFVGLRLIYPHAAFIPLSIPPHTIILDNHSYTKNLTQHQHHQYHNTTIMPIPFWKPGPAPPAALQAQRQPLHSANYLSQLFLQWLNPILKIGYSRPIQMDGKYWSTGPCLLLTRQTCGMFPNILNVQRQVVVHMKGESLTRTGCRSN